MVANGIFIPNLSKVVQGLEWRWHRRLEWSVLNIYGCKLCTEFFLINFPIFYLLSLGITEKLEYLKEIGITATWLSPIFRSPMKDFGYDISSFYDIQPEYGNLDDFDRLIAKAQSLNVKIILDFVPNHSSDENEWFTKSVNKEAGFENFYIWHPGYPDEKDPSKRLRPNNWLSVFRGSAWTWNEKRGEFYFHQVWFNILTRTSIDFSLF